MSSSFVSENKLPRKTKFFYGLSEMPISIANVPLTAFIPNYYGSELGIPLAFIATILLVTRLFDCISDPLIGYLGDKTNTRWGRRKPWIFMSAPIIFFAVYKLFFPATDGSVDGNYLFIWLLVFWLGWTMLLIPYYAWGAELSPEYNERTSIAAWRAQIGMIANVASKVVPTLALLLFAYGGTREVIEMIGLAVLVLIPITIGATLYKVPESKDYNETRIPIMQGLRAMWGNHPFRVLVLAFGVCYIGMNLSTAVFLFYIRGIVQEEEAGIVFLLCYYSSLLCGIPFWTWASKYLGKNKTWAAGLTCFVVVTPTYLFLGPGDFLWTLPVTTICGFGAGATYVMPHSMKADVIDIDRLETGEDRTALFFAVWSFVMKLGAALGPALALAMLSWSGFDSTPGAYNGPDQLLGLRLIFGLSTPIFFGATAIIMLFYPITEKKQIEVRKKIEEQRAMQPESG
ncbi:MAG: MFS transporter [SAR86 cluster bacterium]|jgi:glycoside/pentoside/hexuronide:cation symporter, GPH family|nr:MFS transporter [SAR86 cluster bacterium]